MKHIRVTPVKTTISEKTVDGIYNRATITSPEGWQISVNCQEPDNKTDREQALIKVFTPYGKTWEGSIQDFMSIRHIAENTMKLIESLHLVPEVEYLHPEVIESRSELQYLISLFK